MKDGVDADLGAGLLGEEGAAAVTMAWALFDLNRAWIHTAVARSLGIRSAHAFDDESGSLLASALGHRRIAEKGRCSSAPAFLFLASSDSRIHGPRS